MALNFLVTGVKMLKKSLDKKKMKEKAKKFVGGDKEEKRAKISKIMDKEGSYGGKSKVKKPASISKSKLMKIDIDKVAKVTPDSAKIDYKAFTQKVDNIVGMTDALAFLTGAQSEQKKDELKLLRQQREAEKKRKKEAKLEKKDGMLGKVGMGIKKAAQNPLDAMINFITKIALGALALFLIKNADKIKAIFKNIGENLEGFSKLLRVTIFAFANGMKLARAGFGLMAKGVGKLLSPIQKVITAMGTKIGNVFGSLGQRLLKIVTNLPGIKQIGQLITGAKKTADAARAGLTAKKEAFKEGFKKVGGGVFKKGLAKAPSRLFLKIFGKKGAKMLAGAGKIFKNLSVLGKSIKIPVIGPIIVAVTSILAGDPIGKTLFRSIGAVFGGAIGSMGGPLGMILGEILGEFLGSFLYEMFLGEGKKKAGGSMKYLKQEFGKLVSGAGKYGKMFLDFVMSQIGKVGNFIKDGVGRFIEDFPVVDISKILGLPSALGAVSGMFGMDDPKFKDGGKVNRLPDLSLLTPFGIGGLVSHLMNSLYPSGQKEQVTGSAGSDDEVHDQTPDEFLAATKKYNQNQKINQAREDLEDGKITQKEFDKIFKENDGVKINPEDLVASDDNSDAILDDSSESGGGTTPAKLGESDTSSTGTAVSDVSSQTTYEESAAGTVILGEPKRSDFGAGRSGASQYQQAMVMYSNQKEMLNSYFKTQVRVSLYKI